MKKMLLILTLLSSFQLFPMMKPEVAEYDGLYFTIAPLYDIDPYEENMSEDHINKGSIHEDLLKMNEFFRSFPRVQRTMFVLAIGLFGVACGNTLEKFGVREQRHTLLSYLFKKLGFEGVAKFFKL